MANDLLYHMECSMISCHQLNGHVCSTMNTNMWEGNCITEGLMSIMSLLYELEELLLSVDFSIICIMLYNYITLKHGKPILNERSSFIEISIVPIGECENNTS